MIKIISYQNTHQDDIDEMMQEISSEFDDPISLNPTDSISNDMSAYWVALYNDRVIGTIAIIAVKKKFSILKKMMLKKSFRGREFGVSKILLQTVINWCIDNNIDQIYLGTMNQFKAAQLFYKNNGFQRILENELPNGFMNNPLDTVFFRLKLTDRNSIN